MSENTYYLSANTGSGYISFFDDIISSFKKMIIFKSIPGEYKQKIFDLRENNQVFIRKRYSCGDIPVLFRNVEEKY